MGMTRGGIGVTSSRIEWRGRKIDSSRDQRAHQLWNVEPYQRLLRCLKAVCLCSNRNNRRSSWSSSIAQLNDDFTNHSSTELILISLLCLIKRESLANDGMQLKSLNGRNELFELFPASDDETPESSLRMKGSITEEKNGSVRWRFSKRKSKSQNERRFKLFLTYLLLTGLTCRRLVASLIWVY